MLSKFAGKDIFEILNAIYKFYWENFFKKACEDYGQSVVYKGSIAHHPQFFNLDKHHAIESGRHFSVCGNTWRMLKESRFCEHFEFYGDMNKHFGIFPGCGSDIPFAKSISSDDSSVGEGCC